MDTRCSKLVIRSRAISNLKSSTEAGNDLVLEIFIAFFRSSGVFVPHLVESYNIVSAKPAYTIFEVLFDHFA